MQNSDDWKKFLPNIAISGNFFRTLEYQYPAYVGMQSWLEAVEHPLTNRWQISEVTRRPNTISTGEGETNLVEESRTISHDVGLVEALEKLGEFEIAQKAMGYLVVGKSIKQLGAEHVSQFAKNEGCILVKNKIHPVVGGRMVSDGIFPDGTREEAKKVKAGANPIAAAGRIDLSHLFRSSAQVKDFSRLLDAKIDQQKWCSFVDQMKEVINVLDNIQYNDYSLTTVNKGIIFKESVVAKKSKFMNAISTARQSVSGFSFLNDAQQQMCEKFFQEALLSYEIGYAKRLYQLFNRDSDDQAALRVQLEQQTEKTLQTCRKFGGSEADCQRIQAEIIGLSMQEGFRDRKDRRLYNKFTTHGDCWFMRLEVTRRGAYFMPDTLFEPFFVLDEIGKVFERKVSEETQRIVREPGNSGPSGMK